MHFLTLDLASLTILYNNKCITIAIRITYRILDENISFSKRTLNALEDHLLG